MIQSKPETAALLERSPAKFCRIEWAITGLGTGNGGWFTIDQRSRLQAVADAKNREWGAGSHWVITE